MRLREASTLAIAIALVVVSALACKPRGMFGAADAGPATTTTATSTTTVAAADSTEEDEGEEGEEDTPPPPTATAKPTATARPTAKPTSNANAPCPGPGLTRRCGGVCVNIQTDDRNCGSCGHACGSGKHCDGHMFCRDANGNL